MDYDEDDLPEGYKNLWELLVHEALWRRVVAQGKGNAKRGALPDRPGARRRYKKFYDKAKTDEAWMKKRRAYYKAWRARRKK